MASHLRQPFQRPPLSLRPPSSAENLPFSSTRVPMDEMNSSNPMNVFESMSSDQVRIKLQSTSSYENPEPKICYTLSISIVFYCQAFLVSRDKPVLSFGLWGGLEGGICCNWGCVFKWEVGIVICLVREERMVVVFGFTCVVATTILPSSPLKQMVINFSKGSLKHHPAM
ncbi:hypothetical protein CK203_112947 [Vitis vinifera]|uniref:Uncharacterized protein n=1 Tax=Vitis vinifera TaxID=29760 RepID=A0A438CBG9_VITVI|nr:hypothetical protein CK203_112947 [Vitis vinifera]